MDYSRIYNQLIERGQTRQLGKRRKDLIDLIGQVERHHILPRSLGGNDLSVNLVYLTPEEHFLAHELLVKIHPNEIGPLRALMILSGKNNRYRNNKLFGWARRRYSEMRKGSVPWNKGISCKEVTKEKIRQARKLQVCSDEQRLKHSINGSGTGNNFYGKTHSEESKAKISNNNKSSKKVSCDGIVYNSMADAAKAHGFKLYVTVKKRCESDKWPLWSFCI